MGLEEKYPALARLGDLLTDEQVAEQLGISTHFLRKQRQRGRDSLLPHVKVGSLVRYRKTDVMKFLEQGEKEQ